LNREGRRPRHFFRRLARADRSNLSATNHRPSVRTKTPLDLWSSVTTLRLAREESRPILAVLNRVPARSSLVDTVIAELTRDGVALAAATLGSRVAFAQAMAQSRGVVETAPNGLAASEIAALAAEIAGR